MLSPAQREARDRRIARFYAAGLSCYAIAERPGISAHTASAAVRRAGLTRPNGWQNQPDPALAARNRRVRRLCVKDNLTAPQIAERIPELSEGGVRHVLQSLGVLGRTRGHNTGPRRRSRRFHVDRAYARAIADKVGTGPGTACRDFAAAAGVKTSTLRAHLRALGVTRRYGIGKAKITLDAAAAIKRDLVARCQTMREIAARQNVSPGIVSQIAVGKIWKRAPWPPGKAYQRRTTAGRPRPGAPTRRVGGRTSPRRPR